MKELIGFVIGWFLAIFATHNYGWSSTLTTGYILIGITIFGIILDKITDAYEVEDE